MPVTFDQSSSNPLVIPELVSRIISYVDAPIDLLHCSCVNSVWSIPALQKLYRGSMNDMRFRTPEIGWLNSLFIASRERFARNVGFIKHLTIAPETIATEDLRGVCLEKCRPLRDRRSAELLLRPRGNGPTSLAIPFELVEQDLSPLCDLIIHPDLKFLTIDHVYCNLLNFDSGALHEHTSLSVSPPRIAFFPPPGLDLKRLSNLVALSIHRSEEELEIEKLCEWLAHCDLKIFQIDQFQQLEHLSQPHMVQLLRCLWRHQNLQALALRISCGETGTGEICADLEKEIGTTCWPRLRALYIKAVDQYWLQKLPMFEKLRVLELRDIVSLLPDFVKDVAYSISRCRYLQVVDLEFRNVDDSEIFPTMASGCPLLQRFCVSILNPGPEMTGDQFSRLLQALPQVELLSLSVRFRMTASKLRDLVNCCSRLKVLEMDQTRLHLSLESLVEAPSLSGLRELRLRSVWFENPSRYAQLRSLQSIATEWSRVFPQMRRSPCSADVFGPEIHIEEHPSSRESDGDDDNWSTDNDSEMSLDDPGLDGPGLDFDEYDSDWFHVRRRLWKLLGYEMDDCPEVITGIKHMWQTNFEIGTFDWPIIPMQAFLDPQTYPRVEVAEVLDLTTFSM